jgi:hypothetical protein
MSEACANPVCSNLIPSEGENEWRRTPKKFCSDECRTDAWAIRRTRKLLAPLSEDKQQEIKTNVKSIWIIRLKSKIGSGRSIDLVVFRLTSFGTG